MASRVPLPADFSKPVTASSRLPTCKVGRYSHARGGLFRRPLSLCNPVQYYHLCNELTKSWVTIAQHVSGTALSATTPEFKQTGRAINGKRSQGDRPELAKNTRLGRRYILETDISRFYPSIYTHSVPWALHSKATAKSNRSMALCGNRLDLLIRMGQDQQTVGIPIGPDTSLVFAELIMQRCDDELLSKLPGLKGHRFIDDYELSFFSRTDAENAYHILEACLSEYELALNAKKTRVHELPLPLEATWATRLKAFPFDGRHSSQSAELSHYFNLAFELHSANPTDSVLQFGIGRLRSLRVDEGNWPAFQKLLLLCVIPEPASFPYVLEQIVKAKNDGVSLLLGEIEEIANSLIVSHSRLKHSSEVATAAWACLALGLKLHAEAVDEICQCDDPVVALLALDCEQNGLVAKPLDKTMWLSHMTQESLYDENWLLSYEANIKGWLPSSQQGDHVRADPNFAFLKSNGVYFYDQGLGAVPPTAQVPLPTLPSVSTYGY